MLIWGTTAVQRLFSASENPGFGLCMRAVRDVIYTEPAIEPR